MKNVTQKKSSPESPLSTGLDQFFGKATIEKVAELYEQLQKPIIGIPDTGINRHNLYDWMKGLNETPQGDTRRKYTFTQFIWLKVVEQLRNAGVALPIIIELKASLLRPLKIKALLENIQHSKELLNEMPLSKEQRQELLAFFSSAEYKSMSDKETICLLDLIVIESVLKKQPVNLGVFLDGSFIILAKGKEPLLTDQDKSKLLFDTHIIVSVSKILKAFFLSDISGFVVPEMGLLSYPENKLFEVMHTGDYDSITIHFKDKKAKILELKKSESVKERIIDILDKENFGEIIVKKHRGVVTKIINNTTVVL